MESHPAKLENLIDESRVHSEKIEKGLGGRVTAWLEALSALGLAWAIQKDPRESLVTLNEAGQEDLGLDGELTEFPELPPEKEILVDSRGVLVWRVEQEDDQAALHLLTSREMEVYSWMKQGKTVGETAIILGISPRTVEKHRENALRKIEAMEVGHE